MPYYVVGPDGAKYGPAEVSILSEWAKEGRVHANTMLEDFATGLQQQASAIPGIFPAQQAAPMPPAPGMYQQPPPSNFAAYPRQGFQPSFSDGTVKNLLLTGWLCAIVGPFLSFFCIFGITASVYGMRAGNSLRNIGNPMGSILMVLNALGLVWWAVVRLILHVSMGQQLHY